MYQGPFPVSDSTPTEEASILRELRWTDLVARIAATRGLQGPVVVGAFGVDTSFAAFSRECGEESDRAVNRDGLSHGKGPSNSSNETAANADNGDREIK